ncbi:hypothetical protein RIF29_12591 [Crotalaria pallida]|uniref:Uncharacterized protein n=1 Tax=Crotalaria pallida TaxID=3830 RepID=A0AAN9INA5_CROPI
MRIEMDNKESLVVREEGSLVLRDNIRQRTTSDLVLQWGNRKRLRCMKVQHQQQQDEVKDHSSGPVHRTTVRVDRRVVRTDNTNNNIKDYSSNNNKPTVSFNINHNNNYNTISTTYQNQNHGNGNGYPNLRQRPSSPLQRILRTPHRSFWIYIQDAKTKPTSLSLSLSYQLLQDFAGKHGMDRLLPRVHENFSIMAVVGWRTRNSETSGAMRGVQSNGGVVVRGIASPDRGAHDKRGTHNNNLNNNENNKSAVSSDGKKGGSPSGSGGDAAAPPVWLPKFVIGLTNKEKEEDFLAIKGSKLPQRPKKRAKFIQRTLNLVSPGAWLCDLTLERYEVREKKITKKRPRGLKAMGNMDSDSE